MKKQRKSAFVWLSVGLFLSFLTFLVVITGFTGNVKVTDPKGISEAANVILRAVQTGDWNTLETMISGNPSLSPATGEENTAEKAIWNAYQESLTWFCDEGFEIQGPYVTQQVHVTCLDIAGVTHIMSEMLTGAPTDSNSLVSAAEAILASDPPMVQHILTLTFQRNGGRWQLVPNNALQTLLSGFTDS